MGVQDNVVYGDCHCAGEIIHFVTRDACLAANQD